jgi:cytochrome c5
MARDGKIRKQIRKLALNVLLAATLVAAQAAVASHVDLDNHTVDATCAVCASSSTLGAGNVSQVEFFLPVVATSAPLHEEFVCLLVEFACSHFARAPPVFS